MSIVGIYLIFSMLAVMWLDATRYTIPNWLTGSLILLYPIAVWLSPQPVDWKMALAAMLVVFVIGYFIFAMKWMGGGDIKLLIATSLWIGWKMHLVEYMFLVSILGGALAIGVYIARKLVPFVASRLPKVPRILQHNAPIPYGLAISLAFLLFLFLGRVDAVAF